MNCRIGPGWRSGEVGLVWVRRFHLHQVVHRFPAFGSGSEKLAEEAFRLVVRGVEVVEA